VESGEVAHNYRWGVAGRSCDYFLVQMFEETCRLWPPTQKGWRPRYGTETEAAGVFVNIMRQIAFELAAVGGKEPRTDPSSA
jgi:hypothetical protein